MHEPSGALPQQPSNDPYDWRPGPVVPRIPGQRAPGGGAQ